jgi:hypothetical protein
VCDDAAVQGVRRAATWVHLETLVLVLATLLTHRGIRRQRTAPA